MQVFLTVIFSSSFATVVNGVYRELDSISISLAANILKANIFSLYFSKEFLSQVIYFKISIYCGGYFLLLFLIVPHDKNERGETSPLSCNGALCCNWYVSSGIIYSFIALIVLVFSIIMFSLF